MISRIPKWVGDLFESLLKPNASVKEITQVCSGIKKISFQGDIARMNFQMGYASVIRVSETEYRNYTVCHSDKANGVFDIIFHLHGNGIGSQYVDSLKTGDQIYISAPRGRKVYTPGKKHYCIIGDETSLGLSISLLSALKRHQHQYNYYFELDDKNSIAPAALGLENYSVFDKDGSFSEEKFIRTLPLFHAMDIHETHFIVTGNARSVQVFRKVLKELNVTSVAAQGYWLEGKKGL